MDFTSRSSSNRGMDCRWARQALAATLLALAPFAAYAVGTPAGTAIDNTATVDFSISGAPASITSNSITITVAETVDVALAVQTPTRSATSGAPSATLVFAITNTGNGTETFLLTADSVLVGDDFDPTPASPYIYIDTDGSGDLSPADAPYIAGSNDPVLTADATIGVIVVNAIPAALADGSRGRGALTVAALTGTGAPGTLFAGQGAGGVDALIGASGGEANGYGEYVVGDIVISAVKTQSVVNAFNGNAPIPGATITYQIAISATGSGTAQGAAFTDAIPSNTTYVAGSLSLNGNALSDTTDADAGRFVAAPAGVAVTLGDLTSASGSQTIQFAVTID
jgi:uncharacterized repeat protein (TIGR01451 family)